MARRLSREARLQSIVEIQSIVVQADFDLDRFMQVTVDTVQTLTGADGAVIELVEGEAMVYRCASGLVAPHVGLRLQRAGSLSGLCVANAEVLRCEDAETDPRVDRQACRRVGVRSMICAPLFQSGQPVGVLKVMSAQAHSFDGEDSQTLTLLSGMLGAALGKQLAFEALQRAEARLRTLLDNAHDALVSFDENGTLLRWNQAAERLFGWPAEAVIGRNIAKLHTSGGFPLSDILDEYRRDAALFQLDLRQEMQITARNGQVVTVEYSVGCNAFGDGKEYTAFLHDVSLRKSLEYAMRDQALTDGLTGLPNRRKVLDSLHGAIARQRRHSGRMALLYLDLNDFKQINDRLGHEAGDQALLEFARRIRACLRETDLVGRLGGDEFVVLAEPVGGAADAQTLAEKIVAAIAPPLTQPAIQLATSIGISLYQPDWNATEWLQSADQAMYLAKQQAGSRCRIAHYRQAAPQP